MRFAENQGRTYIEAYHLTGEKWKIEDEAEADGSELSYKLKLS